MPDKRITIIARIHGKPTHDRKMSEPDIYWILETLLERHPEVKGRERDIRIIRGQWTLPAAGRAGMHQPPSLAVEIVGRRFLGWRKERMCEE